MLSNCSMCQSFIPIYPSPQTMVWLYHILFFSWWTFRSSLLFDYYEQHCYKHLCTRDFFCIDICFHFSWIFIYLGVELLGHTVTLCLVLWGIAKWFSKMVILLYIPTSNVWGFHFPHFLANTCNYLTFYL